MEVDFTGVTSVCSFIGQTGLTKFIVQRVGSTKNMTPIFSHLDDGNNATAINEFKKFANSCSNSNEYELVLFNKINDTDIDENNDTATVKRRKDKTVKVTFRIKEPQQVAVNGANEMNAESVRSMMREFIAEQQNNALATELKALKQRIEEIDSEEETTEEGGSIGGYKISDITMILNLIKNWNNPNAQPPVINGAEATEDEIQAKNANIKNAINRLYKHDKQLDTDLLKLAKIAETQPDIFNTIVQTLRGM